MNLSFTRGRRSRTNTSQLESLNTDGRSIESVKNNRTTVELSELAFLSNQVKDFLLKNKKANCPKCIYGVGAVLFVDISGFTLLGRKFQEKIKEEHSATEQLALVIMNVIKELTTVCLELRGDVSKFAGDALICVWKGKNKRNCLSQAKAAAITMLRLIKKIGKDYDLDLHGGISYGSLLDFHLVTKLRDMKKTARWHLLSGSASTSAGKLVDKADRGVILLDSGEKIIKITKKTELLTACSSLASSNSSLMSSPTGPLPKRELVVSYIPRLVLEKLQGRHRVEAEIAPNVSIIFIGLDSLLLSEQELKKCKVSKKNLQRLNSSFGTLLQIVIETGGEIRDLLFDDKGCTFIGVYGGHTIQDKSPQKALKAAQRVVEVFKDARIGISSGSCYAGICGNHIRHDFVIIGNEVNQAARFSAKAKPGRILVSPEIKDKTSKNYLFAKSNFIKKNQTFSSFRVEKKRQSSEQLTTKPSEFFVGRTTETELFERFLTSDDRVLRVKGDKGIGKTAFLFHLKSQLEDNSDFVYCTAQETDIQTDGFLIKRLICSLFNLPMNECNITRLQQECKKLEVALPQLILDLFSTTKLVKKSLPKRKRFINKSPYSSLSFKNNTKRKISDNRESFSSVIERISKKDSQKTEKFLKLALTGSLRKRGKKLMIIVIDKAQYIDKYSLNILYRFISSSSFEKGLKFIFSYRGRNASRYEVKETVTLIEDVFETNYTIELKRLDNNDILQLAPPILKKLFKIQISDEIELDENIKDWLIECANGIPNCVKLLLKYYYEKELIHYCKDTSLVSFTRDIKEIDNRELPNDILEIAGLYLNALDSYEKKVLKRASCLGYTFSKRELWESLAEEDDYLTEAQFTEMILKLSQLDLIALETSPGFSTLGNTNLRQSISTIDPDSYKFTWSIYFEAVQQIVPPSEKAKVRGYHDDDISDLESLL